MYFVLALGDTKYIYTAIAETKLLYVITSNKFTVSLTIKPHFATNVCFCFLCQNKDFPLEDQSQLTKIFSFNLRKGWIVGNWVAFYYDNIYKAFRERVPPTEALKHNTN